MSLSKLFEPKKDENNKDYFPTITYKEGIAEIRDNTAKNKENSAKMIVDINTGYTEVICKGEVIAFDDPINGKGSEDAVGDLRIKGKDIIDQIYDAVGM